MASKLGVTSELVAAVDDDADGSDAAVERGEVETVEKVEGGEDQSGGRPSRMSWWRRRPNEDEWRFLW